MGTKVPTFPPDGSQKSASPPPPPPANKTAIKDIIGDAAVQVLKPTPGSTIVIRRSKDARPLTVNGRKNIVLSLNRIWPDCKIVILEDGMSVDRIVEKTT